MYNYEQLRNALQTGALAPLTAYRQFILWHKTDDGVKIPLNLAGRAHNAHDPLIWMTYADALEMAQRMGAGVAFVLTPNDPFRVLDIDKCYADGAWSDLAMGMLQRFAGSGVEVSQSGTGLHLWFTGPLPDDFAKKAQGLEFYAQDRYIALTGNVSPQGTAAACFDLLPFIAEYFPRNRTSNAVGGLLWQDGPNPAWSAPTDDDALLELFLAEPPNINGDAAAAFGHAVPLSNAAVFNADVGVLARVFAPDKPGEPYDRSAADMSLAMRLAKWTGNDGPRIERLMLKSALVRDKWFDPWSSEYSRLRHDIASACAKTTRFVCLSSSVANAVVAQQSASAYDTFMQRLSAPMDELTLKQIAQDISTCADIDPTLRVSLAGHIWEQSKLLIGNGIGWGKKHCDSLVQLRSAGTALDLRAIQRQQNIALNMPEETPMIAPQMSIAEMLEQFVFISDGSQIGNIYYQHMNYALQDFRNTFAASRTMLDGTTIEHAQAWLQHPTRKQVDTRTFHAGAKPICQAPDKRWALNMWRPVERAPVITCDIQSFVDQVYYLFGNDTNDFLDWLAHIEQQPGVLPHHGWLHIADEKGTGRNWLSSVLSLIWRPYVAPSIDMDALINGNFNGAIAGKVLAIVDEIRAGAYENAYLMEGKIRNMLTEATRHINPKYGRPYLEHNACRWLLFSNHKNAIPMDDGDRRWRVVHLSAPVRDPQVYMYLYGLLANPAYVESIATFLRQRDISHFNPGAKPPMSEAKRRAIEATMSDYQRAAHHIATYWPCDFITTADVHSIMNEDQIGSAGKKLGGAMKHAMTDKRMQYVDRQLYAPDGSRVRIWIVRNVDHWLADLSPHRIAGEMSKMMAMTGVTGFQKLNALM